MKNPKALWESCRQYISQNVSEEEYQKWFSAIELESYNESTKTLKLWVQSQYISEYIENNYLELLRTAIVNTFGRIRLLWHPIVAKTDTGKRPGTGPTMEVLNPKEDRKAKVKYPSAEKPSAPVTGQPTMPATGQNDMMDIPEIETQLNSRMTFRNFIVGKSNKLCHSIGIRISEHPQGTQYNPMFVFGPSGCGKTHLVNAIGLRCKEIFPEKRVLYITARIFILQYTNAVRENTLNDFISFYQTIDMLIVDDIQEWDSPNLKATHNTFFYIFNHLTLNDKRIILVSDRPPVELKNFNERVITRFKSGLVAEMEKPNVQLCIDILNRKIARDGLSVPSDVVRYIAENANGSIRDLEGVINSLMAYSVVYNCSLNMQLAERVVKRSVNTNNEPITIDSIFKIVCEKYNVTEQQIKARTRRKEIVLLRQLIMYLAQKHIHMPTSRIGRCVGGLDHSTVLHGIEKINLLIAENKDFAAEVQDIEKALLIRGERSE